jgi:thiol-disulfide isomerase/thioredoxin
MKTLLKIATVAVAGMTVCIGTKAAGKGDADAVQEAPKLVSAHELGVGRLVPDLEMAPLTGKRFRLSDLKPARATVIAFISTTCPVSKRFAPTLAGLERDYSARGVRFIFVDPLASDTADQIAEAIRVHDFKGPFVRDTNKEIRNALGARSTTEVFVLDAARTLVYRGALDDQYGLAYSLDRPRKRYLIDALDAVLAGKTPRFAATSAPGCALEVTAKSAPPVSIDYHGRISRTVQQHCQECHHTGGVAPFALETYDEVASHAGMIRKMVEKDLMPPWFAGPTPAGHSSLWANDRTLPSDDKRDLLAWIAAGKKEGNPADAPLPRVFPKEWQIGTPDAVVQIPAPIAVKATGKMPYQNVFVETSFGEDRWVRALEVRPTAREVVHHVLVFILPKQTNATATVTNSSGRRRRAREDEGGNFFAAYVPGNNLLRYDEGFAKLLSAGATLQFQIHYTPNGTPATDQTRLGLVFAKEPPRHEVRVVGIANTGLKIPPGAANHEVHAATPVLFDARVMSFMPHMHVRGKAFRYELALPDGSKQLLLDVPRYDFNWQLQYKLAEPIDAPLGSRLLATGWFDNSTNNPANPDPAREVKWGPQTDDEMMLGYLEYYVPSMKPGQRTSLAQMVANDGTLLFNALDKNHDSKITREEAPTPEAFRQADADGDGIVTRDEFKVFLQRQRR